MTYDYEQASPLGDVDLWRIETDPATAAVLSRLRGRLSADERERANRLQSPDGARRWVVAHGALREILARYVNEDAERLSLTRGATGKLALDGHPELRFNLTHSGSLALMGVSWNNDIGVDLEAIRGGLRVVSIARRFFGSRVAHELQAMEESERTRTFFQHWVRLEATVKCRGVRLGDAIGRDLRAGLAVTDLVVGPGYAAALALDGG